MRLLQFIPRARFIRIHLPCSILHIHKPHNRFKREKLVAASQKLVVNATATKFSPASEFCGLTSSRYGLVHNVQTEESSLIVFGVGISPPLSKGLNTDTFAYLFAQLINRVPRTFGS